MNALKVIQPLDSFFFKPKREIN